MKVLKGMIALGASLLLSGCFYVQLSGSVGGADVMVTPLRDQGNVVAMGTSMGPAEWIDTIGQEDWDSLDAAGQLLVTGIAVIDVGQLDPAELYLVTATGGSDYDADGDGQLDQSPTPFSGTLRAVMTGADLMAGDIKVTAISEMAYQAVRASIGDSDNAQLLAALAETAASLVKDVDGNGAVDFADINAWGYWLGQDVIEIDGDSYLEYLGAVREGIDDEAAAEFIDKLINGEPIAGSGSWELEVKGEVAGSFTVAVPATVFSVEGEDVPRTGDTERVRDSIDDLVEEAGGAPPSNIVVDVVEDTADRVVMNVSFDSSLPGLGDVTYNLTYTYTNTGG